MTRKLNVYLNLIKIGILEETDGKYLSFSYADDAVTPISLSMPISKSSYQKKIVTPFFENLLPEGDIIKTISQIYHVSEKNPFSLLNVIGEDCAGAIHLANKNLDLNAFPFPEKLSIESFESLLDKYNKGIPYYKKGMRLSLAGAQNKTTLILKNDEYYIPNFKYPSTHIIKFINITAPNILLNEHYCTSLSKTLNLPSSNMKLKELKNYTYLLIERFDREISNGDIKRINQEDFCQILSISPNKKYQKEKGPGFLRIYRALSQFSSYPLDSILLAKIMVFNFLIGNCDYHGKNLSMIHKGDNNYQLTPFYDLLSTYIYEDFDSNMAMSINKEYDIDKITKEDIIKEIDSWGISGEKTLKIILTDFKKIIINAKELSKNPIYKNGENEINKIIDLISTNHNKLK